MTWLDLIVLILAVYYLQQVLRWESGPFGVFDWVREKVFGVRIEEDPQRGAVQVINRPGTLADLVVCVYCLGFWVALALVAVWVFFPPAMWPFAVIGGAVIAHQLLGGDHGAR